MPRLLFIGGSDSSGGAGVFADLKACYDLSCEASVAVTAVTSQSNLRHYESFALPGKTLTGQLLSVSVKDIDAVKIGMLPNLESVEVVQEFLKNFPRDRIVLDPVFSSSSGGRLSTDEGVAALGHCLFPHVGLITPNLKEAIFLVGKTKLDGQNQEGLASACVGLGVPAALVKGGHFEGEECADLLALEGGDIFSFSKKRVKGGSQVRGTGCRLASAIACYLAMGQNLPRAVGNARDYLAGYITSQIQD